MRVKRGVVKRCDVHDIPSVGRLSHCNQAQTALDRPMARRVLWCDGSRQRHKIVIAPIVAGLRCCASESPEPDTFVFNFSEICKIPDRFVRMQSQSRTTVEKVLRRIIGGISDERLRIDDQPWLTFRPNYIARV